MTTPTTQTKTIITPDPELVRLRSFVENVHLKRRTYYNNHKEVVKKSQKKYYDNNKQKILKQKKDYYKSCKKKLSPEVQDTTQPRIIHIKISASS